MAKDPFGQCLRGSLHCSVESCGQNTRGRREKMIAGLKGYSERKGVKTRATVLVSHQRGSEHNRYRKGPEGLTRS